MIEKYLQRLLNAQLTILISAGTHNEAVVTRCITTEGGCWIFDLLTRHCFWGHLDLWAEESAISCSTGGLNVCMIATSQYAIRGGRSLKVMGRHVGSRH